MIGSVRGEVLDIALDHVVIEAGGIGYRVNATPATLGALRGICGLVLICHFGTDRQAQDLPSSP